MSPAAKRTAALELLAEARRWTVAVAASNEFARQHPSAPRGHCSLCGAFLPLTDTGECAFCAAWRSEGARHG